MPNQFYPLGPFKTTPVGVLTKNPGESAAEATFVTFLLLWSNRDSGGVKICLEICL